MAFPKKEKTHLENPFEDKMWNGHQHIVELFLYFPRLIINVMKMQIFTLKRIGFYVCRERFVYNIKGVAVVIN